MHQANKQSAFYTCPFLLLICAKLQVKCKHLGYARWGVVWCTMARNYRISVNSFCGNYSFLNLALFTVTFDLYYINLNSCRGNYSREETIQGRKLFAEIQYSKASRYTATRSADLGDTRFLIGSQNTWDTRFWAKSLEDARFLIFW